MKLIGCIFKKLPPGFITQYSNIELCDIKVVANIFSMLLLKIPRIWPFGSRDLMKAKVIA
jgi:hypothetical protein